jgi:hypothetical protein
MPSVEFTPVFSPTDCEKAEVEMSKAAAVANRNVVFIVALPGRSL